MKNTVSLDQAVFDFLTSRGALSRDDLLRVNDDFDLLENGYLDSIGFVDLLNHLEAKTGVSVDFTEADPAELATLSGLRKHYEQPPDVHPTGQ